MLDQYSNYMKPKSLDKQMKKKMKQTDKVHDLGWANISNTFQQKKFWKKSPGDIFSHFIKGVKSSSKPDLHIDFD